MGIGRNEDLHVNADYTVDVLVVGAGAAGLTAAVVAGIHRQSVLIVEKDAVFGGSTAYSGGWLWVPLSPAARRAKVSDSTDDARDYIRERAGEYFRPQLVDAFLATGPVMVDFLEREAGLNFEVGTSFPDYYSDVAGASQGGRSIVASPFNARRLGMELSRLRPPLRELTVAGVMVGTGRAVYHFYNARRSIRSATFVVRSLIRSSLENALFGRSVQLTNGNALVGALAEAAFRHNAVLWTQTRVEALIIKGGSVRGAVVWHQGRRHQVIASRGVLLATGGFSHSRELREALFGSQYPQEPVSPIASSVTGDGMELARQSGAAICREMSNPAAWVPVSIVPRDHGESGVFPHFVDRAKPGIIAVSDDGARFTNEADSYHQFVQAMLLRGGPANAHAWLVGDHTAIRRYGLGAARPSPFLLTRFVKSGYLRVAPSVRDLARAIGVNEDGLAATVDEFGQWARRGADPLFRRGESAYNRYQGDPTVGPNPCLAPLSKPPFYAVELFPGDLGTFLGICTDADARVLSESGQTLSGLYAAGNDMASIFGGDYPGAGITLGPAMTFAYRAIMHMLQRRPPHSPHGLADADSDL
jgi:succinate dehydrogenase/fumarate reductase flavoprotein subunit